MMRKVMVIGFIAAIVAITVGSAAALSVGGGSIQSGMDDTLICDADGVEVAGWGYEMDTNLVSFVRIEGIDDDCVGCSIGVSLSDNSGGWLTSGWHETLTASETEGGSPGNVKVSLDTAQQAQNIGDIRVTIEGAESP